MPPPKDKLKKLHASLVQEGYDLPDYSAFEADMADGAKRSKLYSSLVKEGYDLPDEKTFTADMGFADGGTKGTPATPAPPRMIPSPEQSLKADNKIIPTTDNTATTKPLPAETEADKAETKRLIEQKQENTVKAVKRAVADKFAAKGMEVKPGTPTWNKEFGDLLEKVGTGDAVLAFDKEGPGLKRTTKFWESAKEAWDANHTGKQEAAAFVNMTPEQQVDFLKQKQGENPHPEYIGENPSTLSQAGTFLGGTAPFLAKATAAAVVGGMINTASGGTLAGLTPTLMFAVTGDEMINQGGMQEVMHQYEKIREQHPELSEVDAMAEANKGKWLGGIAGGLEAAAFAGMPNLNVPIAAEGQGILAKALTNTVKSATVMGGLTAGVDAAKVAGREAMGVHTTGKEALNEITTTFTDNATVGGLLHMLTVEALPLAGKLPKLLKSNIKQQILDSGVPPEALNQVLIGNEKLGNIPEGTAGKVMTDLAEFKAASDKVMPGLDPEAQASVAGLIQAKEKLVAEKATKDETAKAYYDEKIAAINQQIAKIQETGDVASHEVDEVTGKNYKGEEVVPDEHPKVEAIKIELKVDHDKPTIAAFDQRTADAVRESEPIVKSIEVGAESEREADLTKAIREGEAFIEREKAAGANAEAEGNKSGGGEEKPEGGKGLTLYHGSPHAFENFDISKLGTGEGAQVFGHGLYFTNQENIAKGYATKLSSKKNFWDALRNGERISMNKEDFDFINKELDALGYDGERAENENLGEILVGGKSEHAPQVLDAMSVLFGKNAKADLADYGLSEAEVTRMLEIKKKISDPQFYKVAVHEGKDVHEYLNWHDKVSGPQQEKIGIKLPENATGEEAYKLLSKKLGSDKAASEYLLSKGVDGIVYKTDKGTGGANGEGRNYVVFDPKEIRVDEINGNKQADAKSEGIGPMSQGGVGVMERNKALTTQRIKPVTQTPTDKPVQLNQAIGDLAKDLDAVLVYSKSSRRSAGDYNPANGLQRIRRAGDLDTTAHETGHFLDDRFNILNQLTPKAKGELDWFSQRGGSNPPKQYTPAQQAEYLQREGLAEYIRARAVNPAEAAKQAPELAKEFDALIDDKAKAALQKFSDRVINFSNAPAGDKIFANVQMSPVIKDKTTAVEWLKSLSQKPDELKISWLDDLQDQMIDGLHTAKKAYQYLNKVNGVQDILPESNFEMLARLHAGVNGKIDRALESGLVDSKNNVVKDNGEPMTVKWLFDPLAKTDLKTLEAEQADAVKLLIAERTMEYAGKFERTDNLTGIGGGLKSDMDVATEHINDFAQLKQTDPAKYARIKEGARRYRAFANTVLDYALEKGRISQEQYDAIKDSNQFYVAMTRIGELAPGEEPLSAMTNYTKGGVASVKQILRKAKGGTGLIQNPYVSLLKNTVDIIAEADRNEVMQSFVEPLLKSRKMGQGDLKMLSAIGREVDASETKNAKTVYINGEPRKFQFDKDIYESLTRMQDLSTANIFGKIGMAPGKLLRWSVTHYPVFAARNIVRDFMSRVVLSRSGSGIKTLLHDATDRQLFDLYGGSQAGHHLINRDAYYKTLAETSKEMVKKGGIILSPKKLASGYTKFLEKGENVNRIAEFKAAYAKAKKAGMDDYNAGLQAAFEARDLMDFAVGGHVMKTINKFIPFTNAAMQGLRRSAVGIKENPGKFGLRLMMYTVIPTLLQRALVHNNGNDDEYEQLPAYQKHLFWNFKTPLTGDKWISIPKPFDIGLPSSFVDATISKAQGVDNAYEGLAHSAINVMTPFDEGSLMGPMRSVIEPMVNKNMFLDRPIIPQNEEKLMLSKRERAKEASNLGKALSEGFGAFSTEVDPRMIDHVIKSNASYYGDVALRLSDIGRPDSHNKFGVGQTGFMKDIQISNAKDVAASYDLAEKLGLAKDPSVKRLSSMIREFYGLQKDADREAAAKAIYEYSKKVRTEMEAEYKKEKSK